jgi:hypothetical protein
MKLRYTVGALIGGAIGMVLSYLYSQGDAAAITSNLGIGALIGVLVGLYIVSASSVSGKGGTNIDGCGTERPQFG